MEKYAATSSLLSFLLCVSLLNSECVQYQTVTTKSGSLKGVRTSEYVEFLGIPFATAERFSDPQKIQKWSGIRSATTTGPMCYQNCGAIAKYICQERMSEDCLYLNIYKPLSNSDRPYAVMVFIHGGNFESYSGGSKLFLATIFATKGNVILVTINYRLGPFGFFAFVQNNEMSGNFGLKDQQLALEWIYENIVYFGGSKHKITLFGQSAGAQSVGLHLLSPSTNTLFKHAILQSCPVTIPFKNMEEAGAQVAHFSNHIGCAPNDMNCYRTKSAKEILEAATNSTKTISTNFLVKFQPYGPVMDGNHIPRNLLDDLLNSSAPNKNVIIGTNTKEGAMYAASILPVDMPIELGLEMLKLGSPLLAKVIEGIEIHTQSSKQFLGDVITSYIFYCSSRRFADILNERHVKVWFYIFGQPMGFQALEYQSECTDGACHGGELPFLFDTPVHYGFDVPLADRELSVKMIEYWTNFAKHGTPNGNNLHWPTYVYNNGTDAYVLYFETQNIIVKEVGRNNICEHFDKIGYHFTRI